MALGTKIIRRLGFRSREAAEAGRSDLDRIWGFEAQEPSSIEVPTVSDREPAPPDPEALQLGEETAAPPEESGEEPEDEPEPRAQEVVEPESAPPAREVTEELGEGPSDDEKLSLSSATFEELRSLGLSVTQANRLLRHRDRDGFRSVDDLDQVPGFPKELRAELKQCVSA